MDVKTAHRPDPRSVGRKGGFKSFGSNLPRSAYRGKVEKIREGLIRNAKIKRAYYRTLRKEEKAGSLHHLDLPHNDSEEFNEIDLKTLHPDRAKAINEDDNTKSTVPVRAPRKKEGEKKALMKEEKLALAEEQRRASEQMQKDRERKTHLREKKRKALRKMTKKGQPVMKTRLYDLLDKAKKVMKES